MKTGIVLLAAGMSRRFGAADKLLADVHDRPMATWAMEAMLSSGAERFAAVVSSGAVAELARQRGIEIICNSEPEAGMAHSIVLGVTAMRDMDAVVLLAADQPGISAASLKGLIEALEREGRTLACLQDGTHFGNPAIFGREHFDELLALSGDRGAKSILKKHEERLLKVPCVHKGELEDADDPAALSRILADKEGHDACVSN